VSLTLRRRHGRYGSQFGPNITFLGVDPCDWAEPATGGSRWHEPTQIYVARRTAEGKTKPEIMRYRALPITSVQDKPADHHKTLAPAA